MSGWVTALGVAVAALNVGLTLYHWRLVRRARERLRAVDIVHAATTATLAEARALESWLRAVGTNGHPPEEHAE